MILAAVIAFCLQAPPDTLAPAAVYAVKELPVVRATEAVQVDTLVQTPRAVADLLRVFTGVQVKDYGGAGGLKTVNVRSLGSEHVGIFLDGIQVDNAQNMQVDLGRFSTDGLGQVLLDNGHCKRQRSMPPGLPYTWNRPCLRSPAERYGSGAAPWAR